MFIDVCMKTGGMLDGMLDGMLLTSIMRCGANGHDGTRMRSFIGTVSSRTHLLFGRSMHPLLAMAGRRDTISWMGM